MANPYTLEERVLLTEAHWKATKAWISSGWKDDDAKAEMERLRLILAEWI